ncbi:MAG TPA: hypothetical protein VEY09_08455 [Pyrinomonadaceae bacterium]|nr:hypothetical protein [Pyrinomonadaceae bacterium]
MNEGPFISYLVVGVFGFLLALVIVSVLRRRERARNVMIEQGGIDFGAPSSLNPPRGRSKLEIGRELAPEVERLLRAGDKPAAVALIRDRAGLDHEAAARTVDMIERLM